MISRLLINQLNDWKERSNRKPLILRGARQVGKTTLVNTFAEKFVIYLKLNLENKTDKELFEKYDNIHELIDAIY